MRPWYHYLWRFLKWAVIGVGVMALLLMAWAKINPASTDVAFVSTGLQGCQFTFNIARGQWMSDAAAGTPGFVPKGTKTRPAIFLNGVRFWSRPEPGGWDTAITRQCTIEKRGAITTREGASAALFLATRCAPDGDWYPDHATENFLYSYVGLGREADIIWMAANDKAALLKRENELQDIVKSYSTQTPACVAERKPKQ